MQSLPRKKQKILLIDNYSVFIKELVNSLKEHQLKIIKFNQIKENSVKNFDKLILSGGHSLNVKNHTKEYSNEIKLIRNSDIPILGICLGFELIGHAFGERLQLLSVKEEGILEVQKIHDDFLLKNLVNFKVYENHRWTIKKTSKLKTLAKSKDGTEIIKHPEKTIYGVQFHPEKFVNKTQGIKILNNFLAL